MISHFKELIVVFPLALADDVTFKLIVASLYQTFFFAYIFLISCQIGKYSLTQTCRTWLWKTARGISGEEVEDRLLPKSHGCGKTFPGPRALKNSASVRMLTLSF